MFRFVVNAQIIVTGCLSQMESQWPVMLSPHSTGNLASRLRLRLRLRLKIDSTFMVSIFFIHQSRMIVQQFLWAPHNCGAMWKPTWVHIGKVSMSVMETNFNPMWIMVVLHGINIELLKGHAENSVYEAFEIIVRKANHCLNHKIIVRNILFQQWICCSNNDFVVRTMNWFILRTVILFEQLFCCSNNIIIRTVTLLFEQWFCCSNNNLQSFIHWVHVWHLLLVDSSWSMKTYRQAVDITGHWGLVEERTPWLNQICQWFLHRWQTVM